MLTIAIIILILFIIYVLFSLVTIKYQLKMISEHLEIKDNDDKEKVSDEDIEKELENKFSDN